MSENKTDRKSKTISLAAASTYSSYQLAADTLKSDDPKHQMLLCILHTIVWLRKRFESFDIPQLDYPAPEKCGKMSWEEIKGFEITKPYSLEVMSIPDYGIWTMQLREPDNGNPQREAVRGRIFETNIGFKLDESCVHCGFKTVVTDLAGQKKKPEVFRLGCIKMIAEDKEIGLCQGYRLLGEPIKLEKTDAFRPLRAWLESQERTLPAAVFCKSASSKKSIGGDISKIPSPQEFIKQRDAMLNGINSIPRTDRIPIIDRQDYSLVDKVTEHKMGYAQIFELSTELAETFGSSGYFTFEGPSLAVFEPKQFGGKRTVYKLTEFDGGDVMAVNKLLTDYSAEKEIKFDVLFLPDAKALEKEINKKQAEANKLLKKAIEDEKNAGNAKAKKALIKAQEKINGLVRENEKYEREIRKLREKQKTGTYDQDLIEENSRLERTIKDLQFQLDRYHAKERRPKDAQGVARWVKSEFDGRLIFHKRAVDLMADLGPNSADIPLICDALEYLAYEYRDCLTGRLSADESKVLCAKKYDRPFCVEPLIYDKVSSLTKDYKIKYAIGFDGEKVETALDRHLKIGNKNEDLIRIYFLYDSEKQLIVVGSLPKHLPTQSYK